MLVLLILSFFVTTAINNSQKVRAEVPIKSLDYWMGNISPRCVINVIYLEGTNDFLFNSTNKIPVMFASIKYSREREHFIKYLKNHKFYDSSLRFMKAECYFSILHYKQFEDSFMSPQDAYLLNDLIAYIAYGFPDYGKPIRLGFKFDSNLTFCLILFHGSYSELGFRETNRDIMEMNLAVVMLSNDSKSGYDVYCKANSLNLHVAARNVTNEVYSVVDQNFIITCSSQHTFVVLNEHNRYGMFDPERLVYENQILTSILLKANVSICPKKEISFYSNFGSPRVIVLDFNVNLQTLSLFLTFDDSIRLFTCYTIPFLSFHFYVSAFRIQVWMAIIFSGILIATFLQFHIYYNLSKILNFSTLLFYFSIFMEEAYSIPSTIQNNKVYRTASILWLLTAIVLTNSYISHVISGLNAPLAGKKVETLYENSSMEPDVTLDDVADYYDTMMELQETPSKFFHNKFNVFLQKLHSSQASSSGYTILSEPVRLPYPDDVWLHLKNPYIYTAFQDNVYKLGSCFHKIFSLNSSLCRGIIRLMGLSNKYYPDAHVYRRSWNSSDYPTGAVEEELIKCQKSVYMERNDQLEFKYMSENYKKKRFYYLQNNFESTQKKWSFYNLQKSKLPFYFSMILQSGIFHELHKMKLLKDYQTRKSMTSEIIKRTHKPEVLDINSSVQTVFILFLAMTLLASIGFVLELSYSACNMHTVFRLKRKLAKLAFGEIFFPALCKNMITFKVKLRK